MKKQVYFNPKKNNTFANIKKNAAGKNADIKNADLKNVLGPQMPYKVNTNNENKIIKSDSYVSLKPGYIKSDIVVSVGILVSNHIKYIRKGLESIKPLLDSVPSELIVVDTVGEQNSDGSLAVAREFTDKIYHFDWINDFSAARNELLKHSRGEWFLYFDDDEYFDDVTEFIEFFKTRECDKYGAGIYYTGDYTAPDKYYKSVALRMVRRLPDTHFEGRIHECFNEAFHPAKEFKVFTHHFGYMYETAEQRQLKDKRNTDLLEAELKEKGPNARLCAQIIQQMMSGDKSAVIQKSRDFAEILKEKGEIMSPAAQWLLLTEIKQVSEKGTFDEITDAEKRILDMSQITETTEAVIDNLVAIKAYNENRFDVAYERVKRYLVLLDFLNTHPYEKMGQLQFDFSAFLTEYGLSSMIITGAQSAYLLQKYEEAYEILKRLDVNYCNNIRDVRNLVIKILTKNPDPLPLIKFYKNFYRDEFFTDPELKKYLPENVRNRV